MIFLSEQGFICDERGELYLDAETGEPITETEYYEQYADADGWDDEEGDEWDDDDEEDGEEDEEDDAFTEAMAGPYHRLRTALKRDPTSREFAQLVADAELTGDPNIDQAYERVTGRPLGHNTGDDSTRLAVTAEYAAESMDPPAIEPPGEHDEDYARQIDLAVAAEEAQERIDAAGDD